MTSVSIIGVGRVGGAFALSLPKDKYSIDALVGRNDEMPQITSDIVFITTQDPEIVPTSKALAELVSSRSTVYHTCKCCAP